MAKHDKHLNSNAQSTLDAIDQSVLSISKNDGSGTITQATLDALATNNLANVIISADKVANIANGDKITLAITSIRRWLFL